MCDTTGVYNMYLVSLYVQNKQRWEYHCVIGSISKFIGWCAVFMYFGTFASFLLL